MQDSRIGHLVRGLAVWTAIIGGVAIAAGAVLTTVSVSGRALGWAGFGSIRGDYELVEAGVGFAVFAFMPFAHLTRAHAIVTILTDNFGARANAALVFASDLLMLAAALFLAWRHFHGMLDKLAYGETTLLLRMPLWWAYVASMLGAVVFVVVAGYVLIASWSNLVSATPRAPQQGAGH